MNLKEIALIAPYRSLYELSNQIITEINLNNVSVFSGDSQGGESLALKLEKEGYKIIISRGGTFTLISKALTIPTVEIQFDYLDILSSLQELLNQKKSIIIIGTHNILQEYEILQELFPAIKSIIVHTSENIESLILSIPRTEADAIIGDTVVANICDRLNIPCVLLKSSKRTVLKAFAEAQILLQTIKKETETLQRYKTFIDHVNDGIIVIDNTAKVLFANSVALAILKISRISIIENQIASIPVQSSVFKEIEQGKVMQDEIRQLNTEEIIINTVQIDDNTGFPSGKLVIFQNISNVQSLEHKIRIQVAKKKLIARYTFDSIVYKSKKINECVILAKKYSEFDSPVLIEGESGVGKELFAQSIHNFSPRKNGPFVAVNCAAFSPSLIESELFGYVEGAFTGSKKDGAQGVFEQAHKGTIFLDEISEIPFDLQGKLLRVIQEREVKRLGADKIIPLDVRILCAANKNLYELIREGKFRKDLFYRISILFFEIPPLRKRPEDIEVLANFFLHHFSKKYSKISNIFSKTAIDALKQYKYEGNIRELQGIIERTVILCDKECIHEQDLLLRSEQNPYEENLDTILEVTAHKTLEDVSNNYILQVYNETNKNITKTCSILNINRTTLWKKLKQIGN